MPSPFAVQVVSPYRRRTPNFLVISPPKTGSTWLADNLRCHPDLFVPSIKEVKYFRSFDNRLDFNWYLDHFQTTSAKVVGEASPSYATLPVETIRHIRNTLPNLKLIFLMREPVSRAWSHAKHMHRYGEGSFADESNEFTTISAARWRECLTDDWAVASGDYLGQLRRWASVFPLEQFYVGFYESIASSPLQLLRDIYRFLGVDPHVDTSTYPVRERILQGPPGELTAELEAFLFSLFQQRTSDLAQYLRQIYDLSLPSEWSKFCSDSLPQANPSHEVFHHEWDDEFIADISAQEDSFPTAYRELLLGYRGFDIIFYRSAIIAIPETMANLHRPIVNAKGLKEAVHAGTCLIGPTLEEVKNLVTLELFRQTIDHSHRVERQLQELRQVVDRQSQALDEAYAIINRPSRARRAVRRLRRVTRKLLGLVLPV